MGNDLISFNARFGGVATDILVSIDSVLGIYARENGRGMLFPEEGDITDDTPSDDGPNPPTRPRLKVIK